MGPKGGKWNPQPLFYALWRNRALLLFIGVVILHISPISASGGVQGQRRHVKRDSVVGAWPQLQLDKFEQLFEDDDRGSSRGSSEFTIISPLGVQDRQNGGKGNKRVVRRRRKKVPSLPSITTTPSPTVIAVTLMPSSAEPISSVPIYEAAPKRRYKKKSHAHKVPEVWKVQNFNLHDDDDGVMLRDSDLKHSILDKRESSEHLFRHHNDSSLLHNNSKDRDLNYDESINNHPFFNSSSTPISNELQNSLQFTLQFLHPLLNSDAAVLSEDSPQHPENKTVALIHTLSESVAQTPVSHDLGFIPTHLKKKHPLLLNQDSILSGEGGTGASKTGIRTNYDVQPTQVNPTTIGTTTTTPTLDTTIFSITASDPLSESSETTTKPSQATTSTTTKVPRTRITTKRIPSTRRTPTTTTTTEKTTTSQPTTTKTTSQPTTTKTTSQPTTTKTTSQPTTTKTTSQSTTKFTTSSSTPARFSTTPIISTTKLTTITTTKPHSTTLRTTTSTMGIPPPFDIDHILGILNITEVTTGSSSEATAPNSSSASGTDRDQLNEAFQHPPVIMFPVEEKAPTTATDPNVKSVHSNNNGGDGGTNSAEVSSAEQLFVEQLLGISGPGKSHNGHKTTVGGGGANEQSDSGEQILQLFSSLIQLQNNNQAGKPNSSDQKNPLLLGVSNSNQNANNNNNQNDAQINSLLQNLILSSLTKPQKPNQPDFATNLLNLESLLQSSSTTKPSTSTKSNSPPSPPTTATTTKLQLSSNLKAETGLSDADLKSIFALLDSQTNLSSPPTQSATTTTTTTTTSTPPPTSTSPPPTSTITTTLHPALQSMLDLFTNQLKPFQSIPSSAPTFLQTLAKPTATVPPPTTPKPSPPSLATSTLNSIDLLSQLLSLGGGGLSKVNPPRSTPSPAEFSLASIFGGGGVGTIPQKNPPGNPEFSLASIFGNIGKNSNTNSIFPNSNPSLPKSPIEQSSIPSESNQLLNYFGTHHQPTPPPPNGLYYWLDMNAFLGGDPKADGMAGIRPKIGNRFPFIKVH